MRIITAPNGDLRFKYVAYIVFYISEDVNNFNQLLIVFYISI